MSRATLHADDVKLLASRQPKPAPDPISGKRLAELADALVKAEREHLEAEAALAVAAQKAIDASAKRWDMRREYTRAAVRYAAGRTQPVTASKP